MQYEIIWTSESEKLFRYKKSDAHFFLFNTYFLSDPSFYMKLKSTEYGWTFNSLTFYAL